MGCTWDVEFEDGGSTTVIVPPSYSGSKTCKYTGVEISYDANDTYDVGMFELLDNLDYDDDGKIFLNL